MSEATNKSCMCWLITFEIARGEGVGVFNNYSLKVFSVIFGISIDSHN